MLSIIADRPADVDVTLGDVGDELLQMRGESRSRPSSLA